MSALHLRRRQERRAGVDCVVEWLAGSRHPKDATSRGERVGQRSRAGARQAGGPGSGRGVAARAGHETWGWQIVQGSRHEACSFPPVVAIIPHLERHRHEGAKL